MKDIFPKSELRQLIDTLATECEKTGNVDPQLIFKTCQSIAMAASANDKPIPLDVFALGVSEKVARIMLSSLALTMVGMIKQSALVKNAR